MRLGGLGQLWQTLLKLVSIMFVCQLLSPVVAFMAILLLGTDSVGTSVASELTSELTPDLTSEVTSKLTSEVTSKLTSEVTSDVSTVPSLSVSEEPEVTEEDKCCKAGPSLCPSDHRAEPHLEACQGGLEYLGVLRLFSLIKLIDLCK